MLKLVWGPQWKRSFSVGECCLTSLFIMKETVIINKSLGGSDIAKALSQKYKIRESGSTLKDSCILPKSGAAFLLVKLNEIKIQRCEDINISEDILDRLEKLAKVHPKSIVIPVAAVIDKLEQQMIFDLQMRFLKTGLTFIPAHNSLEVMEMFTTSLPNPKKEEIADSVKGQQAKYQDEETILKALQALPISRQECGLLLDCLGSVSGILHATKQQLMDCSLDSATAEQILAFANQDEVQMHQ